MENKYKCIPFWSWNDELEEDELIRQIEWMHDNGVGGFFMHARGGLTTPYLGEKWFKCVNACLKKAEELGMEAYAYDENGWPSGFVGGKLLENPDNSDYSVSYSYGPYDKNAVASFSITEKSIKRVNEGNDVLNIYLNRSKSTVDILNPKVVDQFIQLTHEQYKKHDEVGNLRGFFTDEPQYFRWGTPFTFMLVDYFKEHYNEDVFDRIALLFVNKEGYRDYRYKYFKALQDLMLNNYSKRIYDWCDSNGYKFTGHYVEENSLGYQIMCCGGIMPFYEYEHIPGVDHLGRPIPRCAVAKQLGSVMSQLDKRQGLCEMFACAGWDATPLELKKIADFYMVNGINLMCQHLLPYSEHGQRKRDYPEHYSEINPWVEKAFKTFNDHFSEVGERMAKSSDVCNVGLFSPIRSAYFEYQRDKEDIGFNIAELDKDFVDANQMFVEDGINFHILDEVIMAKHAHVENDELVVGQARYKYIVIPKGTLTMDVKTMELFKEYADNGGKFLLLGKVPSYLEGKEFNHDYMHSNVTFEEIRVDQPYSSSHSENIVLTYRIGDDGKPFFFVTNCGNKEDEISLSMPNFQSFECDGEIVSNLIHLDIGQSKILIPSKEQAKAPKNLEVLHLGNSFDVVGEPLNYLTLDYVSYSFDNKQYGDKMHHMGAFDQILKSRYQGKVYLKYEFDIKNLTSKYEALIENTNTLEVYVNGHKVDKSGYVLEKNLWSYNIASYVKEGHNEIIVLIDFKESENVYYALFGKDVLESIKNCLVYDTTIEPIYIRGDFGVYGEFKDGESENVVIGNNFYLDKQKRHINSLIKDGYPFFRGEIVLSTDINVDNVDKLLWIDKRFQLIDLYVNDQFVKRMLFDYKVDLSSYLKVGNNKVTIKLVVSNRNLLGPFHQPTEELIFVGPYSFERFQTWDENGKSPLCLDRYSFVKTII